MSHALEFVRGTLARWKRLSTSKKLIATYLAVMCGALFSADVVSRSYDLSIFRSEQDKTAAPIDRGDRRSAPSSLEPAAGSARPSGVTGTAIGAAEAPLFGGLGQTPSGGGVRGAFGQKIPWPVIPIHMSLLPDGRVLTFGTDREGKQGAYVYDIWDPKKGVGTESHTTLPNTTPTDIFCNTGSWFATGPNNRTTGLTGKYFSLGGDLIVDGTRNFSNSDIVVFDPGTSSDPTSSRLIPAGRMAYPRWYATFMTQPNGDKLLLGGQLRPGVGVTTAEVYRASANSWRALSSATIPDMAYLGEWFYPRAAIGKDGLTYLLQNNGRILKLDQNGTGTLTDTAVRLSEGAYHYPTVNLPIKPNYPPFRTLSIRRDKKVQVVDLSASLPVVSDTQSLEYDRRWSNLTLLANGNVLLTGGSGVTNELTDVVNQAEIYWPVQGIWTPAATASVARLYHSTNLLLPDGSVLTGGGGAPGPIRNLNAEIFYPPYLYNTDGTVAPRPTIVSAPTSVKLAQHFYFKVAADDRISYVTLVRAGNKTHAYDPDERVIYPAFAQNGTTILCYIHYEAKVVPPGYYMLFAFDSAGHPSLAKMVTIQQMIQ